MRVSQPCQACVAARVSGWGKRHVPGTLWMHLDPLCPARARQPQTLRVTLIFWAGAASAWMAAPVGYVGWGL